MSFYAILCLRPLLTPEDSYYIIIQDFFLFVFSKFYPFVMFIMSQCFSSYFKINTLLPFAPISYSSVEQQIT